MLHNLCLSHSYLPSDLVKTVAVLIIKNKIGDVADKPNYRSISLATIIAIVLDSVLNSYWIGQLGFVPGLSTETAILNINTVKFYTDGETPVYACFLDLSKAFDTVCYDIL